MDHSPYISVVSPVYMGEKMVHELVLRLQHALSSITDEFEIILVNDYSPDDSWHQIVEECKNDSRVKGINLSRNYGQHRAITAGLNYARGEWVVVMDCDLQDDPEDIPIFYHKAQEGYDIVQCERENRKDGYLKRKTSSLFYSLFSYLSGIETNSRMSTYGIYKQSVIKEVCKMPERDRGFMFLIKYLGFNCATIPVEHGKRYEGKSSYSFKKLFKLAFGSIISNTNKPLRMMVGWGFVMSFFSLMMAIYNVIAYFCGMIGVAGFTSTIFSIWFVGGMIMMQLGIVGIYIGKVFDQVKGRPLYVVKDEVNIEA